MAVIIINGKPVNQGGKRRQRNSTAPPAVAASASTPAAPTNCAVAAGAASSSSNTASAAVSASKDSTRDHVSTVVSDTDLATTIATLQTLQRAGDDVFKAPRFKALRATIFPLINGPQGGHVARVSAALAEQKWNDAILTLERMQERGEVPKLGSVQRWVRDCDVASVNSHDAFRALDMLLRVAAPEQIGRVPCPPELLAANTESPLIVRPLIDFGRARYSSYATSSAAQNSLPPMLPDLSETALAPFRSTLRVLAIEKASDRLPPNKHDMTLWTSAKSNSEFQLLDPSEAAINKVKRIDIPTIPGCFLLKDVFTVEEAHRMIQVCEAAGFAPDEPLTNSRSILAHNVCWIPDADFMQVLVSRVKEHLPQALCGSGLVQEPCRTINRRFRVYRYTPGAVYRAHVDGAWSPCGIIEEKEQQSSTTKSTSRYVHDISGGTELSRLTFLMYLNDGFSGGCTTFLTPAFEKGRLDAQAVVPRCGSVLVFPHGDTLGTLVHEGSGVTSGTKVIIRTEVEYEKVVGE